MKNQLVSSLGAVIILAIFTIQSNLIMAQRLLQPLESIPLSRSAYVLLKNGDVVDGKILWTNSSRGITKLKLEDNQGNDHTLNAEDIREFAIAVNGAVRLQYSSERASSVKKLLSGDQPTAKPDDFIIYRNTTINGQKEQLLQLLNPDFDKNFEVYYDPFARKTTSLEGEFIVWTGDKHRAYFISKGSGTLIKVKKGNYKRTFMELFGDCPQMLEIRKRRLSELETHILQYESYCQPLSTIHEKIQ